MNLSFPSKSFDDVVASVCRGEASEEEMRALNGLLLTDTFARDEYLLRVELHSRLASEPEIFVAAAEQEPQVFSCETCGAKPKSVIPFPSAPRTKKRTLVWVAALAACFTALAMGIWEFRFRQPVESKAPSDKAVAILNRTVDAQWNETGEIPQVGTLLQPGRLELQAGFAQFVFYSGARVMIEGPAQIELTSPNEISCRAGRLMAEVPSPARAFHIRTPQVEATSQTASLGLEVRDLSTEVQVFKGSVDVSSLARGSKQKLQDGTGVLAEKSRPLKLIAANTAEFASLLDLQTKSLAAEAQRLTQWRAASSVLNRDPSLLVHLDFEGAANFPQMRLRDSASQEAAWSDGIVGCQMVSGRWADKQGLEFLGVNDRVRLTVPGEFNAMTLSTWVRVQGLDRQFNSLFMCDGFEPGEIHWMIVNNGDLALTIKGNKPGRFQAVESPPVLSPEYFGTWVQLTVVVDGKAKRITLYFNGRAVKEQALYPDPPYRIGASELGNWNADEFPINDQEEMWIRNFNGAMDEFCLFSRALSDAEIMDLYLAGKPDAITKARKDTARSAIDSFSRH
jgi:hypothetical protein